MNRTALNARIPTLGPFLVPRPIARAVEAILGCRHLSLIYEKLRQAGTDRSIVSRLLQNLNIDIRVSKMDLDRIPRTGAVLVVVNHPSGILDGAVLIALLSGLRNDLRILANQLLTAIPELRDVLIQVDVLRGRSALRANASSIQKSVRVLTDGGLLVAFPAGCTP
jgi:putative hemolysin